MEIWGDFSLRLSQVVLFWTSSYVSFQHTHAQFLSGIYLAMELLGYNVWEYLALISPVQFSRSVVSDSVTRGLQHARPPCPSPTPGVYPNSCPLSQWCCRTISSSVIPFSSCLQSFPASGSLSVSLFFASGGHSIEVSASACPCNEHPGLISFRMDWLDLLAVQANLKSLLPHHSSKASILRCSAGFNSNAKLLKLCRFLNIIKMVLYSMLLCVWLLFFSV